MDVSSPRCVFLLCLLYSRSQRDHVIFWALEFEYSESSFILFVKEMILWLPSSVIRTLIASRFIKFSLSNKSCCWLKISVEWEGMVWGVHIPIKTISAQRTLPNIHEVSTYEKARMDIHKSLNWRSFPFLPFLSFSFCLSYLPYFPHPFFRCWQFLCFYRLFNKSSQG